MLASSTCSFVQRLTEEAGGRREVVGGPEQPARTLLLSMEGGDLRETDQPPHDARAVIQALNVPPYAQATLIQEFGELVLPVVALNIERGRHQEHPQQPAIARLCQKAVELLEKGTGLTAVPLLQHDAHEPRERDAAVERVVMIFVEANPVLSVATRVLVLAAQVGLESEEQKRVALAPNGLRLSADPQAVGEQSSGFRRGPLGQLDDGYSELGIRDPMCVVPFTEDRERLLRVSSAVVQFALFPGEKPHAKEGLALSVTAVRRRARQHRLQPRRPFAQIPPMQPVERERSRQLQPDLRCVGVVAADREGRAEVDVLALESVHPHVALRLTEMGLGRLRQGEKKAHEPILRGGLLPMQFEL